MFHHSLLSFLTNGFIIVFIWILLLFIKVKVKFLNCLTVTCFFIAAKLEEDVEVSGSCNNHMIHIHHLQNVPSLHQLVQESGCGCSSVDIQRMELIVMQKLDFNLVRAAPLEFLQIVSNHSDVVAYVMWYLVHMCEYRLW